MNVFQFAMLLLLVVLSGCHILEPAGDFTRFDDATFMRLWGIYNRCRTNEDLDQMWNEVQRLTDAARTMAQREQAARILPDSLEQLLAEPPSRLAADPRAMAASCALSAGQAAQVAGRPRFAAEMFGFVLSDFAPPQYAYYRARAFAGLSELEQRAHPVYHPLRRRLATTSTDLDY